MNMLVAVAFTALAVLSALQHADASAYDKIVYHSRVRARLQGPNVCAMQQVEGTKKKYFSTCRNWYLLPDVFDVVYECCPGYMKMDGLRGCPAVAPIENVYGTLGTIKATSTQSYSDSAKLRAEIEGSGSFTFFAPSNDAWDALDEVSALVSNVNIELYNALHYHMANKRFLTKDLKNGMVVTSMYNDLGLHINHYSNGVVTVNCARIIHGNQVATNGVVHVVDRVVSSVGNSIAEVLDVDDDLTTLTNMARDAGLMEKLGEPGQYTIFAPTNEAFDKLGSDVLERIMSDKDVLKALLNFHLLNTVQCSEGIMLGTSYETLEGNSIEVGCDGDSLTVNGIKMVMKKDIVTTNGVIHLIDQVLMPDSAKEVMELLGPSQSTFGDLVGELGLSEALRAESAYTLLAPFNAAFTDEVMDIDQSELKIILENHVLKSKVLLGQLYNGQLLETIAGKFLRVFVYRTAVCIENSCLVRGSKEGSNGAIHQMRILMKPAEKDMYEILMEHGGYKIFLSLVESAGLTDMLRQDGDFTLFAPSDKAFRGVSQSDLAILTGDLNALRTILLYHFNNGVFIGGGLEGGVTNLLKSLQGSNLRVLFANNSMQVNTVKVPESDVMATNGVVHFIDSILYPADIPVGSQDLMGLLQRMISYFQIKYIRGFRYQEIPLTFMSRTVPQMCNDLFDFIIIYLFSLVDPAVKKFTRVIQGETRVITEVQPSIKKVTRVIDGQPVVKKVTRVIERDPVVTTVTRLVTGKYNMFIDGTMATDQGNPNPYLLNDVCLNLL
uniref:Periostin, osteoblast specific factor b n=1 Tax=Gadus morhua TaxID=8049 RepID=A0A8C5BAX0_GADMO